MVAAENPHDDDAAPRSAAELRRQAEELVDGLADSAADTASTEDTAAILHELRVHQVELIMQNEELRRAQVELETSREAYVELLQLAPVGYITLSDTGIVSDANLAAAQLLSVDQRTLRGQPFSAFVFGADRNVYYQHLELLKQSDERQATELRLQPLGAEPFWVRLEGKPARDTSGGTLYRLTFDDISERANTTESLRASEARYRSLFEDNHAVMLLIDPASGAIVDVNPAACSWYGWSRKEMLTMRIDQINTLSSAEISAEMELATTKQRRVFNFRHRWADGTIRDVEVYSGPIKVQGKALLYSLVQDVTERKQAEARLRESAEQHEAVLQTAMDGFWLVSAAGRLLEVNEAYSRMSGYSIEELLTMGVSDLESTETAAETAAHIASITALGADRFESRHRRKDGTVIDVESSTQLVVGGGGEITAFLRDITELKVAEAYREMGREILSILNAHGELNDSIRQVITALKAGTGVDAVGIRLQQGEDFPYFSQEGLSEDFLATENVLIERDSEGGLCRDDTGRPLLACTCGLVIDGPADLYGSVLTPGGSFWTNDSVPLLDLPADQDPRRHPRNECIHYGYVSIALVPIREKDRTVGLIHLNDRRKDLFTLKTIELLEGVATLIGEAFMRRKAEAALHESEERHRLLAEHANDVVWTMSPGGRITYISPAVEKIRGFTPEEAINQSLDEILTPESAAISTSYWVELAARLEAGLPPQDFHGEYEYYCKDGSTVWTDVQVIPSMGADGQLIEILGLTRDISERKHYEDELRQLATTDELTGIANRRHFIELANRELKRAHRSEHPLAVALIDVDHFKHINDGHGHAAGDRALVALARTCQTVAREVDVFARVGGDEFALLLPETTCMQAAATVDRIRLALQDLPTEDAGPHASMTISAGVADLHGTETLDELMSRADIALYRAKETGRDRTVLDVTTEGELEERVEAKQPISDRSATSFTTTAADRDA
ncbi:MAG: PAS domain S-box protein [Coriobacteriia bacterium]